MIGLTGVQRSGKTTLAQQIAKEWGLPFIPSPGRAAFEKHNLMPNDRLSWAQRREVQTTMLRDFEDMLSEYSNAITDRTPLDMVAYTLSTAFDDPQTNWDELHLFMLRAFSVLERFNQVLLVQSHPDLKYTDEPFKGRSDLGHVRQLEATTLSLVDLMATSDIRVSILRRACPLDQRLSEALSILGAHNETLDIPSEFEPPS